MHGGTSGGTPGVAHHPAPAIDSVGFFSHDPGIFGGPAWMGIQSR